MNEKKSLGMVYSITSPKYNGVVTVEYVNGILKSFNFNEADLGVKGHSWFLANLQLPEELFLQKLKANPFTVTGADKQLTFTMFWDAYDHKTSSSKKKAETTWNRLSSQQQILAYMFVHRYFKNIPPGVAKKYAETYLNSEIWNN